MEAESKPFRVVYLSKVKVTLTRSRRLRKEGGVNESSGPDARDGCAERVEAYFYRVIKQLSDFPALKTYTQ